MGYQGLSGNTYAIESAHFSQGGEGNIFRITNDVHIAGGNYPVGKAVAKIYHPNRVTKELENKLKAMANNPPDPTVLNQVAWPLDLLYNNHSFCGFIMPKLNITNELNELYNYPPAKQKNVTLHQKLIIAQNICAVIEAVHFAGYVFGDFNPHNIGVNVSNGNVAFLDTDSYHFYDKTVNYTYRCKVCLDGYVAPELLNTCANFPQEAYALAPLPTFTQETDNFALAIHIFKLLMNGFTPYNGIKTAQRASTAAPGVGNNAIRQDNYCFKPGNKPQAVAVPPIDILPRDVADLFTRAFIYGKTDPKKRPSAHEWYKVLGNYDRLLTVCPTNSIHMFRAGMPSCPWCEADKKYSASLSAPLHQRTYTSSIPVTPNYSVTSTGYGGSGSTPPVKIKQKKKSVAGITLAAISFIVLFVIIKAAIGGGQVTTSGDYFGSSGNSGSSNNAAFSSNSNSSSANTSNSYISPTDALAAENIRFGSCPGAAPQRLVVSDKASVCTKIDRLIVREQPLMSAYEFFRIYPGTTVNVVGGPECAGDSSWWLIEINARTTVFFTHKGSDGNLDQTSQGWVREGSDTEDPYFLCPVN